MHQANILQTIQYCEAHCENMTTYFTQTPDRCARFLQLTLLRDCADICGLTAKFIARNSPFAKHLSHICATICEACGTECLKFPDPASQHCAQVCLHCAHACRQFAG